MSVVGVDYSKVDSIVSSLSTEMSTLADTIDEVSTVSASIEATFGGQAGAAFQNTMSEYVTKAKEAIPVLESIKNWVTEVAAEYNDYDVQIAQKFKLE